MQDGSHQLRCVGCAAVTPPETVEKDFRCVDCGQLLEVEYPSWSPSWSATGGSVGDLRRMPNPGALRWLWRERLQSKLAIDRSGVWRFREVLPILLDDFKAVTLREGNTPLYRLLQCGESLGLDHLYAKHQGMNPTGSFKDTGMTAALSQARERGFQWVACASTGNTSASMAAYASRAGMNSLVLLPAGKISWSKLSQALDYGAVACQLNTDFDGCVRVLSEIIRRAPVYLLNSVNPYRLEGQKTAAIEIAEDLDWQVPDHLIVPGGNLANSSALGKGFLEMAHLGLCNKVPRISVVQAEGANPLYLSFLHNGGRELEPVQADTRATAIRIGNPASWRKAARVIRETGGYCEQVSEPEIALAKAEIGQEGIGCEPASAVTLAGLKKLMHQGKIERGASVVLLLTGHTLKDSEYIIDFHQGQLLTSKEMAGLDRELEQQMAERRRPTLSLEASADAVLRVLEAAIQA
ncbi:MAG: threonine synthase [Acidobacteriaceae bacterium]